MDEPFSHLDRENTELALELILKRCNHLNAGCLVSILGDTYYARFDKILYL
jgi:energy-coupling factor transporter ATP-binding protein EcfA2